MIVFLHIPRTGGVTMVNILCRQYNKVWRIGEYELANKFAAIAGRFECIAGHIPYGVHRLIPDTEVWYVTMLREPAERVASNYFWCRNRDGWKKEGLKAIADKLPLAEFAKRSMAELDNLQTRYLAGMQISYPIGMPVTEYDFDRALLNLEKLAVVGITEAYAESARRFADVLDWEEEIPKDIGASNTSSRSSISPLTRKIVRERNRFDQRLYDWVKERYDA